MIPTFSKADLWLVSVAGIVGSTLMFVLLSSAPPTYKNSLGLVGIGLGCVCLGLWFHTRRRFSRSPILLQETILIASGNSAEIVFLPKTPITNPVLVLRAYGQGPQTVIVEDVEISGLNALPSARSIEHWQHGVSYPGFLNAAGDPPGKAPLKILVRNVGKNTVAVYAHVSQVTTRKD